MLENTENGTAIQEFDAHGNITEYKLHPEDGTLEDITNKTSDKSFIPKTESELDGMC